MIQRVTIDFLGSKSEVPIGRSRNGCGESLNANGPKPFTVGNIYRGRKNARTMMMNQEVSMEKNRQLFFSIEKQIFLIWQLELDYS